MCACMICVCACFVCIVCQYYLGRYVSEEDAYAVVLRAAKEVKVSQFTRRGPLATTEYLTGPFFCFAYFSSCFLS